MMPYTTIAILLVALYGAVRRGNKLESELDHERGLKAHEYQKYMLMFNNHLLHLKMTSDLLNLNPNEAIVERIRRNQLEICSVGRGSKCQTL